MMTRHHCLLVALCLASAPVTAAAQEYTLKLKQTAAGDAVLVKKHDQFKMEFTLTDAAGNALQSRKESSGLLFSYHETGLEKAAGADHFTSLKRDYQKAERHANFAKEALPYQGKTVVINKKEGKYQFRIDGGDVLDGKDAEELNHE